MTKALIIGGGIAGPITAIALRRAGVETSVHEAYDRTADGVGAFLTLAVNGLAALRVLELEPALASAFDTPRMVITNGSHKPLAEFAFGSGRTDGLVSQTVKRSDLYTALRDEAVRRGATVEYGNRLVDTTTEHDRVIATFDDGSTAEGDFLVGADGLRSRARQLIDPHAPSARYVGLLNTGGYARGVDVGTEPGVFVMLFGRRCFFGYTVHPNGEVWWFANPPRATEPTTAELTAMNEDVLRAELRDLFARDHPMVNQIIDHTDHVIEPWPTHDFPSVPRWHADRLIIIGDAAHATSPASGQGASMAIEDAIVLAKCVRDTASVPDAFTTYEQLRRKRVEDVVKQGKRNGSNKAVGPVGRLVRDHVIFPAMSKLMARRTGDPMSWIHDYRITWDAPVHAAA